MTRADDQVDTAHGFRADSAFQNGDVDSVNLFNGSVSVTIPVPPAYSLNAGRAYAIGLVYIPETWKYIRNVDPFTNEVSYTPSLAPQVNAGIGWRVTMGRLYPRSSAVTPIPASCGFNCTAWTWVYESPDGATHVFADRLHSVDNFTSNVYYTRDGTYLRLKDGGSYGDLEFPDGTIQRFSTTTGNLMSIRSPWESAANPGVQINYLTGSLNCGGETGVSSCWQIVDNVGRTQYVTFEHDPNHDINSSLPADRLHKILLTGPNGQLTYSASYDDVYLPPDPGACGGYVLQASPGYQTSILRTVTLPDNTQYKVSLFTDTDENKCHSGILSSVTIPTGGKMTYEYGEYVLSYGGRNSDGPFTPGVRTRTKWNADGSEVATWAYSPNVTNAAPPSPCNPASQPRELTVDVTSSAPDPGNANNPRTPLAHTQQFFTIARASGYCDDLTHWRSYEYGLPFTPKIQRTDGGITRNLSTRILDPATGTVLRETYVLYERDGSSSSTNDNRRIVSSAAIFKDDGDRYTARNSSGFDGLGHYRTVTLDSSLGGNSSTTINYNATASTYVYTRDGDASTQGGSGWTTGSLPSTTAPWILSRFDTRTTTEPGQAADVLDACFDSATGSLLATRKGGTSPNALVAVNSFDSSGNLSDETFYGGDDAQSATGTFCPPSYGTPRYRVHHTHDTTGVVKTTEYYSGGNPIGFLVANRSFSTTGALVGETDSSGISVSYNYDGVGRLHTAVGAVLTTTYDYYAPSGAAPPKVIVTTGSTGGQTTYEYDSFGRLRFTRRLMPGNTLATQERRYDALGRTIWTSELGTSSSPATGTSTVFDALSRPVTVTRADGTSTSYSYTGVSSNTRSVGVFTSAGMSTAQTKQTFDGQGRLVTVQELTAAPSTWQTTNYGYDAAGHLTEVCVNASSAGEIGSPCSGQRRTFHYDGRGLMDYETQPENGTVHYTYDARGHILTRTRTDTTAFDLQQAYDDAERLSIVKSHVNGSSSWSLLKEFAYGTGATSGNHDNGKLISAKRHNWLIVPPSSSPADYTVTETYSYTDAAGRMTSKDTDIVDGQTSAVKHVTQAVTYNELSLPQTVTYPTCSGCGSGTVATLTNSYDVGFITNVAAGAAQYGSLSYYASGMVNSIHHGNEIYDTYTQDTTGIPRPTAIQFSPFNCALPNITQPGTITVSAGTSATINASVTGAHTYQWYDGNNQVIAGATSSTYVTPPVNATQIFTLRATNACGFKDQAFTVTISSCTGPTITSQPAGGSVASGGSTSLSVTVSTSDTPTYQWYASTGSGWTPVGTNSATLLTGPLLTTTSYYVHVTACGTSVDSNVATVTVNTCTSPTISSQPSGGTVPYGGATTLTVGVSTSGTPSYQWYKWTGSAWTPVGSNSSSFSTSSLFATTFYYVHVSACSSSVDSSTATVTVGAQLPTPQNLTATGQSTSTVLITWSAVAGAASYDVYRKSGGGSFGFLRNVATNTLSDTLVVAAAGYAYEVRALDAQGLSASNFSNIDASVTIAFTSISSNPTGVAYAHLSELLDAVNAVRGISGTAPKSWSEMLSDIGAGTTPVPTQYGPIYGAHLMALRNALNNALSAIGVGTTFYTDPTLPGAPPVGIRKLHIQELRDRAQ